MREIFTGIADFLNIPVIRAILSIILIVDIVYMVTRLHKVLQQPDLNLYSKQSLQDICFSLECAIDGYKEHFLPEKYLCNADYVRLVSFYNKVCKLLGENPDGSKIKK